MGKDSALALLEKYREFGWEELEPFFGNFERFYNYLKRNGATLSVADLPDDDFNIWLFLLFEDDPETITDYIVDNFLRDVEKKDDGYYLKLDDREDISEFFKDTRYESTSELVKGVVGEDWYEPFDGDTTQDVYNDVIDNLTPKNLEEFKGVVLGNLDGIKIDDIVTELMSDISTEQGHGSYMYVSSENIDRIVADSETMNFLLDNYLGEVNSELYSLHTQSYNDAYVDEVWDKIMSELSTYFEPEIHVETKKLGDNKVKYTNYLKINDLPKIIHDFLSYYKSSGYTDDTMEYHGSFTGILTKMMSEIPNYDFLDFRAPDWPDYRRVIKNINEGFGDYF